MTPQFDPDTAITTIKRFLTGKLLESSLGGFVVGLSGGIDSSLSATLAVEAVGAEKVLGVMMPYTTSSSHSLEDARKLADWLKIETRLVEIAPMVDAYFSRIDDSNRLRAGNKMARERMSILFDIAHETQRLVLGTGNRTEICLGYTTLYGDSACSLNPIGELYKTEVRALSKQLGVPDSIIAKAPSADLWVGQTDEGEIGVTYKQIDSILVKIVDEGVTSLAELEKTGISQADASKVLSLLNRNAFKRFLPEIAPLGKPTIPKYIRFDS